VTATSEDSPTEPFPRIEAAAPAEPRRNGGRRARLGGAPEGGGPAGGASPWQRSHAVWHRAGVDWVHTVVTAPQLEPIVGAQVPQDLQEAGAAEAPPAAQDPRSFRGEASSPPPQTAPAAAAAARTPAVRPPKIGALPPPRRDPAWPRPVLSAAAVAVVVTAGAVGFAALGGGKESAARPAQRFAAVSADRWFAVDPAAADGLDQRLTAVAGEKGTVIAAGGETGGPDRGRFLVSVDAGRTWRTARVRDADGAEPPPGEIPHRLAGGAGRWLAVGGPVGPQPREASQTVVWTSSDGLTWTRRGGLFAPGDQVLGIARTAAGFTAVGTTGTGGGTRGVLWTSADGAAWRRVDRPALGGEVRRLDGIAAFGGITVVHGAIRTKVTETERRGGRKRRTTRTVEETGHWVSGDGGRTWSPVRPGQAQGSFGGLTGLTGGPNGLFAVREAKRTTGPRKRRTTERYAVVWHSPDGRRWTPVGQVRTDGYKRLERLAGSPDGLAALVDAGKGKKAVLTSADGRSWRRVGEVTGAEVAGLAAVGGGAVVAGRRGPDPYLATSGGEVRLASVPGAIRPERAVHALAAGPRLVAVGSANGRIAAWTSADGRNWTRGSMPESDPQPRRRLTDVVHGPAGWLAVGRSGEDVPVIVVSGDGAVWTKGPAPAGKGHPLAAAHGPGGYVAVGRDGRWAAAWHSADLKGWKRGSGMGEGRMHDVAVASGGYVAVGARSAPDRPAAWTSADGGKWRHTAVPLPSGLASGSLHRVAARGALVVALGTGLAEGSPQPRPFAAVSADGGRTWQAGWLPDAGAGAALTDVTATARGFVVAGSAGRPGARDVLVWTTTDGRSWRRVPASGTGLDGAGDQWLTALAATSGELLAVGVTGDHRGETPTFWRRPLP